MAERLQVVIKDASFSGVSHASLTLRLDDGRQLTATASDSTAAPLDVSGANEVELLVETAGHWPHSSSYDVDRSDGAARLVLRTSSGYADAQRGDDGLLSVTVYLGVLRDASDQLDKPIQDGTGDIRDLYFPAQPVISDDPAATGWSCLRYDEDAAASAAGRIYFLERKSPDPPNLVAVWRPDYMTFDPAAPRDGVGFHLFFTPVAPPGAKEGWGAYPFGHGDDGAQGWVHVAYRYMFWEKYIAHQTRHARREALLVVPVVSPAAQQGSLPSSANVLRLLREINMYVHFAEGMPLALWAREDVGRVALDGFSYGVTFVKSVLDDTGDKPGTPPGSGRKFYSENLREVYDMDGNVSLDFLTSVRRWRAGDPDRRARFYKGSGAAPAWAAQAAKLDGESRVMRFGGVEVREGRSGDGAESIVVLPHAFVEKVLTGVPDAHQWFPSYFVAHALALSGFVVNGAPPIDVA